MPPDLFADALRAYLTQYVGLGLVFVLGLVIAWRSGDVGLKTRRQRRWLLVLGLGMLGYALMHGFFQFVAPSL